MADKRISFNEQGAKRIVNVVREVERTEFHPANRRSFYTDTQYPLHNFIPVKIKNVDDGSSGGVILHSWVRVELGNDGKWTEKEDWDKGGPDYGTPEKSLLHPDNIAIEKEAIVLAHWSIDREFLLAETDHIIAYKLLENMTAMNLRAKAKAVDGAGAEYGPEIYVIMNPFLINQFGPALAGWYGYAQFSTKKNDGVEPPAQEYNVIYQQRFAKNIDWSVTSGLDDCEEIATVVHYYDGEEPVSANVKLPSCFSCECFAGEQCGSAAYCPNESTDTIQVYHITLLDQLPYIAQLPQCATDPCIPGTPIKNIRIGDGLEWELMSCNDYGCLGILSNPGISVIGLECGSSGSSGALPVYELDFEAPLEVVIDTNCPAKATIGLADGLITGSGDGCISLTVTPVDCKYQISATMNPDCIPVYSSGSCIGFETQEDGSIEINNTLTLTAGTCIEVVDDEEDACNKIINNTMTLEGGDYISVEDDEEDACKKIISNTMQLEEGDCITINENAGVFTITNDVSVIGGDGINVTKSGCTYSVNLAGSTGDPTTSFSVLCDIDIELTPITITCVENSGSWSFEATGGELTVTKKYTTITLPDSLMTFESDCTSSGGGGGDPTYSCDDCEDCEEGFDKIMESATGDCDCISHSAPISEGWIYCDDTPDPNPEGTGIQFNSIDCDAYPPHYSITFLGFPTGATSYIVNVTGDLGSSALVGPISVPYETIVGQEYWQALVDDFGTPQAGECFTFQVLFDNGASQTFSGCCA